MIVHDVVGTFARLVNEHVLAVSAVERIITGSAPETYRFLLLQSMCLIPLVHKTCRYQNRQLANHCLCRRKANRSSCRRGLCYPTYSLPVRFIALVRADASPTSTPEDSVTFVDELSVKFALRRLSSVNCLSRQQKRFSCSCLF